MDPSNNDPVLDPEVIAMLKELGGEEEPGLFVELVDLFIEDTCEQLGLVSEALINGDAEEMRRRAHTLKSSCANVGAVHMAKTWFQMEKLATGEELQEIKALLESAKAEFDEVKSALILEKN